ncbi:hypothetical protein O181_070906 [Austropuccinia psidii MF-1]|uniref:Uncharacterized protein n=1 Tax=Austropuccinia psidii MF-1 TaxID=1389203 RepID=A0A9Q3I637_9BASI|nr:hypothetical protein [Austropuccinia psidii MF-1]
MSSPNDVLLKYPSVIQPVNDINHFLCFRIKVFVKKKAPSSQVHAAGQVMSSLKFEPYADTLRVLDINTGKVKVTRHYAKLKSETTVILRKDPCSLPRQQGQTQPQLVDLPSLKNTFSK